MNSDYYYGLVEKTNNEIGVLEEKKNVYDVFFKALENFKLKLDPLPDYFEKTEIYFENGGYIDSGETLSKGLLRKNGKKISDNIEIVKELISKTNNILESLESQISYLNNRRNNEYSNYCQALRKERGGK